MRRMARRRHPPRLLITMPWGIGDAVSIGLSAVDQVTRNDPSGEVTIDVLCNHLQAKIFAHDPRICTLFRVDDALFPTAAQGTWKRGIFLPRQTVQLAKYLRDRYYSAVMPFLFAPGFFYLLHTPVLFLNIWEAWQFLKSLRTYRCQPIQYMVRQNVNKFFVNTCPKLCVDELIPLYLCPEHIKKARQSVASIREQAGITRDKGSLVLVAPDTSSVITRPPTSLLARGIARALQERQELLVQILPSYTETRASRDLWKELVQYFPERVFLSPTEPQLSLLDLAALIDQSEIFITGDTCTMHLAAAYKMLADTACRTFLPRNQVKIIVLFGGTHPGFYGYHQRTVILGKGRKEQLTLVPGIAKDIYNPRGKDLFDHISPQQLTRAILEG